MAFRLPLLLCIACAAPQGNRQATSKDLTQGFDANGRIPKVALPDDIPNPERWRYLPEGRIVEGSFLERFLISSFAVPIAFFRSDVGAGGGVSITDIDFRTQRRREFATVLLTQTTEGQQNFAMIWRRWLDQLDLPAGGVLQEERSFVQVFAGYSKTLTRRFFGLGPGTAEGDETSFTDEVGAVAVQWNQSIPRAGDDWVTTLGVRLEQRNLSGGFIEDFPSTEEAFPNLVAEGDSLGSLWVEGGLRYDTRDSQHNPYAGYSLGARFRGTPWMERDLGGTIYGLDGRAFVALPGLFHEGGDADEENPPTDVLALTIQAEDTAGDLPFWALPTLGGNNRLRGYIQNRFTDRAAWFAAAEYRFAILPRGRALSDRVRFERVGMALFYELGAVAPGAEDFDFDGAESSYGVSLRLNLERAASFRFDLGFSDEGSNVTIQYGLSF